MKKDKKNQNNKPRFSLTWKIAIAFIIIIILPVIFMAVMIYHPMSSRLRSLGQSYGLENLSYSGMYNNSLLLSKISTDSINELKENAESDPGILNDTVRLNELNFKLREFEAYLVLTKDGEIVYNGGSTPSAELLPVIKDFDFKAGANDDWITIRSDISSMVKSEEVKFADGHAGQAFVITNMNQIWPGVKRWLYDLVFLCILSLGITALLMGFWIYASTVYPLLQLKKAAQNIRDGNLDFQVEATGSKEMADVCQDFEEMRKRLKENAEEKLSVDKGNKELISNISHDLKTPITAIRGYCEGIMDGVADTPEKMDKYVRTIYNKANEMDKLINELTLYSKIDTNKIPYTFAKLNVKDFFNDCVDELGLELGNSNVALSYKDELKDPSTIIIGDAEQLKRVIHNIINNSVKYMDKPDKKIEIRLLDKDDFIQAEFEDNGKGIAKSDVSLIFDRFYRTDSSRNSTKGGSGIGLSIVKKILEDHGGNVWATSTEGEGTTIHFVIRKYQEVRM